jgi:hypothetical protein
MLKVEIANFRNLRRAALHDEGRLSIVVGDNEDGKSSLCGAIQFATSGQAYGLKGSDVSKLITRGEERMQCKVQIGDKMFSRTKSGGETLKENAARLGVSVDVLPLLFDQKLVGDGGNKHIKSFLQNSAEEKFECSVAFKDNPEILNLINKAKIAGNLTTKQIIKYMETMRAQQTAPPRPAVPACSSPTDAMVEAERIKLEETSAKITKAKADLDELADAISKLTRFQNYLTLHANWESIKASANSKDELGETRGVLAAVTSINTNGLDATANVLKGAGYLELSENLAWVSAEIKTKVEAVKAKLTALPPPPKLPPEPTIDDGIKALASSLNVSTAKQAADMLAFAMTQDKELRKYYEDLKAEHTASSYSKLLQNKGTWAAYNDALPKYDEAVEKAKDAWALWDRGVKYIQAAEREFMQNAGDSFGLLVEELGGIILQGRKLKVDLDKGIMLGDESVSLLSLSTQWRVEVAVLAAIAITCKSPLLILDGADILSEKNKGVFMQFLLDRIVPRFEHVLVTATMKGTYEEEKPITLTNVNKWLIRSGEISKVG